MFTGNALVGPRKAFGSHPAGAFPVFADESLAEITRIVEPVAKGNVLNGPMFVAGTFQELKGPFQPLIFDPFMKRGACGAEDPVKIPHGDTDLFSDVGNRDVWVCNVLENDHADTFQRLIVRPACLYSCTIFALGLGKKVQNGSGE